MISGEKYKSVRIHIVTYKKNLRTTDKLIRNMSEERKHNKIAPRNKLVCPVCSNLVNLPKTADDNKKINKLFSKTCELCLEKPKIVNNFDDRIQSIKKATKNESKPNKKDKYRDSKSVGIQTQDRDLNKGLNLLNEVLTVFQTKKQTSKETSKTVVHKDASISTEFIPPRLKPKLQISKVYQFSTNDPMYDRNNKSTIITSHDDIIRSHSLDLPKHKSSSIPQMKLEELKNSLKEKTRSKDAVEEVNRMFANVRRRKNGDPENLNRPLVRHGPRILPVVKKEECTNYSLDRILSPCNVCRSEDFSSGDSLLRSEHCNHKESDETADKCVYMMCCQYKNCHKMQTGVLYCKCCKDKGTNFCHNPHRFTNPD